MSFKAVVRKVGRAVMAVIHDPAVRRSAKSLAALAITRALLAVGASAEVVALVHAVLH